MARKFGLSSLLRIRETAEQRAAQELARAREKAERARNREVRATQSLGDHEFDLLLTEHQWQAAVAARASMRVLLTESQAVSATAENEATDAQNRWATAKQHVAGIEKLKERHIEREREEEGRREQVELDEIASQSHYRATLRAQETTQEGNDDAN